MSLKYQPSLAEPAVQSRGGGGERRGGRGGGKGGGPECDWCVSSGLVVAGKEVRAVERVGGAFDGAAPRTPFYPGLQHHHFLDGRAGVRAPVCPDSESNLRLPW